MLRVGLSLALSLLLFGCSEPRRVLDATSSPRLDATGSPDGDARDAYGGDLEASDRGATDAEAGSELSEAPDADAGQPLEASVNADAEGPGLPDAEAPSLDAQTRAFYPAERCSHFLTGEMDVDGIDADGDGIPNGWDHCPNNPADGLDSDRDGTGNASDPDMDGDGIPNEEDPDRDGDGVLDVDEVAAGSDPTDPSSMPGVPRVDLDQGILNPNPGWYRGDVHVHTTHSHDGHTELAEYVPAAENAGLHFLWITDHRTFEAPFEPAWDQRDVLFIPGQEWGGPGHANMGGIRTGNLANWMDPSDVRRSWRLARLQGAVQSLNHYGQDMDYWDPTLAAAPDLLDALDVLEVWNSLWPFNRDVNEASLALWDRLLSEGRRIGLVGGSDTHYVNLTLGMPTTVVWAQNLSVLAILDGLRRGRSYVTQSDPYRDGVNLRWDERPTLEFRVDADGDGHFEAMLGDEVAPGRIVLQIAIEKAHGPVTLVRSGVPIAEFDAHARGADLTVTHEDVAPPGAWYRVQMRKTALPRSAMLLLSSPIYVRP